MADLIQFILVRTDMASMTIGRIAAQCAHAANQMVHEITKDGTSKELGLLDKWQCGTLGCFGTSYIMDVGTIERLERVITEFSTQRLEGKAVFANVVVDPTYVVHDGTVIHLVKVVTCGYIFGTKEDMMPFLKENGVTFLR